MPGNHRRSRSGLVTAEEFFHGTRADLGLGDSIKPSVRPEIGEWDASARCVFLTPNLDEAIWEAEIGDGEGLGRVYVVQATGPVGDASEVRAQGSRPHPSMSLYSFEPLRVVAEVTEWTLYHGTRADLRPGDLIRPGRTPNFGDRAREARYVYCSRTLDAATWGAELASGAGPGRIYVVEPTGPVEDDPNLTDRRFRGNPTKSFRSRAPLLVVGEVDDWQGHSPEALRAMKEAVARLERQGVEPIDE